MIVDGIVRSEPLVVYADTRANIEAAFAVAGMHAYATDTGRIGWYDAVYAVWRWGVVNLNDLADVNAPYPNDGDYLVYDAVTSQWITSTAGPGGVSYFISLLDTPSTYHGRAGYACVVDGIESGLVFENLDNRYFRESEYVVISNGVPDAGLPVILDSTGRLDISLIPGAAITTVLNDLLDVNAHPVDGDVLTWSATTSQWVASSACDCITVHAQLSGLLADDHTQYLLVSGARAMSGNLDVGGYAIINVGNVDGVDVSAHAAGAAVDTHASGVGNHSHQSAGAQGGQIDHGLALTGLTDDDHTQYLLVAGTRAMTGNLDMGSHEIQNVSVITIANTGLRLLDTGGDNYLTIKLNENVTANRTLNVVVSDGDRTLTLSGNLTVESASLVNQDLTTDANVNFAQVTLPDSGKLILGTGGDGELYSSSDDVYIANATQDKDIYIQVNDGGVTKTPFFVMGSNGYIGVGNDNTNPSFPLELIRETALTNSPSSAIRFITKSTGNMVDGFGGGFIFAIQDDTSTIENIAIIYGLRDGADNSGALTFRTASGGAFTTHVKIASDGGVLMYSLKSGATQAAAGAAANELWITNGHATLPNNVVMIGV